MCICASVPCMFGCSSVVAVVAVHLHSKHRPSRQLQAIHAPGQHTPGCQLMSTNVNHLLATVGNYSLLSLPSPPLSLPTALVPPPSAAFEKPLSRIGGPFIISIFSFIFIFSSVHSAATSYPTMQYRPGTPMSIRPTSKFDELFAICDPEFRLVTSPWVTPRLLFFIRLALASYSIVAGVFDLLYNVLVLGEGSR